MLRRRRLRHARTFVVALLVAFLPFTPAAATVVYCISDDGHSGFELVSSAERGCGSCCHQEIDSAAHAEAGKVECRDVALSSPDAVPGTSHHAADVALPGPPIGDVLSPVTLAFAHTGRASGRASPARSDTVVRRRVTVLLI